MKEHAALLRNIIDKRVIERVNESSDIDVSLIKELHDSGLIEAIDACSFDGLEYLEVKPNLNGRQWLTDFEAELKPNPITPAEDVIDVKPNFMGVGLNLNALFRKLFNKKT